MTIEQAGRRIEACKRLAEAARKAFNPEREEYFYELMRQSIRALLINELAEMPDA